MSTIRVIEPRQCQSYGRRVEVDGVCVAEEFWCDGAEEELGSSVDAVLAVLDAAGIPYTSEPAPAPVRYVQLYRRQTWEQWYQQVGELSALRLADHAQIVGMALFQDGKR